MSHSRPVRDRQNGADAHDTVLIDRSDRIQRRRYRCPNGHVDWDRTNSHIWCRGCRRASERGEDVDPEHWEIVDEATGKAIPWSAVEIEDSRRRQ